jgi:hypothetical protein
MRRLFFFLFAALTLSADPFRYFTAESSRALARLDAVPQSNPERGDTLQRLFAEAGCSAPSLSRPLVRKSEIPNVSCHLEGPQPGLIIVMAHFDKVKDGQGLIDNWSGASMLPSLLEALKMGNVRHSFLFLGTSDEERGLYGSTAWVKDNAMSLLPQVRAVVNLDSLGAGPTQIWLRRSHKGMAAAANGLAAALKLPLTAVDVDNVGDTDSRPFSERKIPTIDFHSLTQQNWKFLHSPEDHRKNFQTQEWLHSLRLLSAYVAYLDANLDEILALRPAAKSKP